jgi:hypothetical protein
VYVTYTFLHELFFGKFKKYRLTFMYYRLLGRDRNMLLAIASIIDCKIMEATVQNFSCYVAPTLIAVYLYVELHN